MVYVQFIVLVLFLCAYIWFFSSYRVNKKKNKLKKLLKTKVFILDVRSSEEYKKEHIQGAVNIASDKLYQKKSKLPATDTKPLILYGHTSAQVKKAMRVLRTLGYKNLINAGTYSQLLKLQKGDGKVINE